MSIYKLSCKLLGHKWGNQGIIKTIDGEEAVTFTCRRCGEKQVGGISFVDDINEEEEEIIKEANKFLAAAEAGKKLRQIMDLLVEGKKVASAKAFEIDVAKAGKSLKQITEQLKKDKKKRD